MIGLPRALLLDLDGTLVHSEAIHTEGLVRFCAARGLELTEHERLFVIGHAWQEIYAELRLESRLGVSLAEVIRGGLQAVPKGQHEAADALGLSYWRKQRLIILPQAIRHVIPPLVNTFIAFFKDTSLVLIIGIFDLLTTAKTAIIDPPWQQFSIEVYIFVAAIYFAFCFAMSRYSRHLEAQTRQGK